MRFYLKPRRAIEKNGVGKTFFFAVGEINFHPRKAGGYRPNAGFDIEVGETQLNQALSESFLKPFFRPHFWNGKMERSKFLVGWAYPT